MEVEILFCFTNFSITSNPVTKKIATNSRAEGDMKGWLSFANGLITINKINGYFTFGFLHSHGAIKFGSFHKPILFLLALFSNAA